MARRVYWDACAFIALLNRESGKIDACSKVWEEAKAGDVEIYTSFFTFAEVFKAKCEGTFTKPLSQEADAQVEDLLRQKFIRPAVVDERIGIAARRLMRQYPECKKPADGIHVATAMSLNVDEMHTTDGDLQKLNGKVLRADGQPLTVCFPRQTQGAKPSAPQLFEDS